MRSHASPPIVQGEGGPTSGADVQRIAATGIRSARSPLPYAGRIARAFGANHNISGVRAVIGGPAAVASRAMGTTGGYATRERIAFARPPSLRVAAHEAAHIIQQRGGLGSPGGVGLYGGVGRPGDVHERHADAVADRVVRGQSASDLLARYAGPMAKVPSDSGAVQMWKALANAPWMKATGRWDTVMQKNKVKSMVAEDLELTAKALAPGGVGVGAGASPPSKSPKSWGRLLGWGMTHPANTPGYVRMHMLSDRFGGQGSTKENLAPGTNSMNQKHFNKAEKKIIAILEGGGTVLKYKVKAMYQAPSANLATKTGKSAWKDTLRRLRWSANYQMPGAAKKNTSGMIKEYGGLDTKANWTAH